MRLESTSHREPAARCSRRQDPFQAANGYHRIALEVMRALRGQQSQRVIVNVRNQGAIDGIDANDVVEVPCRIAND